MPPRGRGDPGLTDGLASARTRRVRQHGSGESEEETARSAGSPEFRGTSWWTEPVGIDPPVEATGGPRPIRPVVATPRPDRWSGPTASGSASAARPSAPRRPRPRRSRPRDLEERGGPDLRLPERRRGRGRARAVARRPPRGAGTSLARRPIPAGTRAGALAGHRSAARPSTDQCATSPPPSVSPDRSAGPERRAGPGRPPEGPAGRDSVCTIFRRARSSRACGQGRQCRPPTGWFGPMRVQTTLESR